jgi:uncharacterized protein with HEPN domain
MFNGKQYPYERYGEANSRYDPGIPWSSIIGTRNVIVHGYDQVKLPIVWDIIHKDLSALKASLLSLV